MNPSSTPATTVIVRGRGPLVGVNVDKGTCTVDGCDKPERTRSWCAGHYKRWHLHGDVLADRPLARRMPDGETRRCVAPDCENAARAREMCPLHWQRWRLYGSHLIPPRPTKREAGTYRHGSPQGYNFHKCRCDECAAWNRTYVAETAHKYEPTRRRHQLAVYGITLEEYEAMAEAQDHACAVCRLPERQSRKKRLAVDHCHETGIVRGLLCHGCNVAAGFMRDDPALVDALAGYLRKSVA